MDGSFPDFLAGSNCALLSRDGDALVFDYCEDPELLTPGRTDMLQLKTWVQTGLLHHHGAL